jgi:hypothetical protein
VSEPESPFSSEFLRSLPPEALHRALHRLLAIAGVSAGDTEPYRTVVADLNSYARLEDAPCENCGFRDSEPGRNYCNFCRRLFKRINYIADRVGCPRPSDRERNTVVARLVDIHQVRMPEDSRLYMGFTFPEEFFVTGNTLDYRLLFHSDNVIFFRDRAEYDAHRDSLQEIPPEYLHSKFEAWRDSCLRTAESPESIRRRLTAERERRSRAIIPENPDQN